jgi:hypothetical protein
VAITATHLNGMTIFIPQQPGVRYSRTDANAETGAINFEVIMPDSFPDFRVVELPDWATDRASGSNLTFASDLGSCPNLAEAQERHLSIYFSS